MMKRLRWLVVVSAVFGLIAASCGGDDVVTDSDADAAAAAQAEAEAAAAAAQAEADAAAARADTAAAKAAEAEAALEAAMAEAEGAVDPEVVAELEAQLEAARADADAAKADAEAAAAAAEEAAAAATATDTDDTEMMGAEPLRAAVVTPSAENDLAFSQSIVDALHRMEEAGLLSEVAVSPGLFIVEDAGLALRDYAEEG